jgi:dTDP-4-dehydrorhamnose 3,5-epimerase
MVMKLNNLSVCDAFSCDGCRYYDHRGYFQELFSQKNLPHFKVAQINCSVSAKNVLRGLHVVPFAKLVFCVKGQVFDVVADVRKDSKSYLKYDSVILSGYNEKAIYIPPNCGHGFLALEEDSIVVYAQDGIYDPTLESIVNYADPQLNIKWPFAILSEKDAKAPVIC